MNNNSYKKKSNKSNGFMKKFGIGLAGGVLGGALMLGGYTLIDNNVTTPNSSTNSSGGSGNAQVSNVSVNVNSDITSAVEKVQDAVVSVINYQAASPTDFFGNPTANESGENTAASEGSGVIYNVDGDAAYVVTNNHVIAGANSLSVVLADGTTVDAELVGTDEYTDLAVLKINSDGIETTADFGDSDALTVGEPSIAIGSPLGTQYANSVTSGIISSLDREVSLETDTSGVVTSSAIQTDAAINPGNSGGPLINIEGQVIGINSSKIVATSSGTGVEGMGFAIPSNQVVNIINQLVNNGEVVRPAIGVTMYNLSIFSSQQRAQYLPELPSGVTSGVVVATVSEGSPAAAAGLEQYDVITEIDGEEISTSSELRNALYDKNVGDTMEITFYRGGEEQKATIELSMTTSELNSTDSGTTSSN